MRKSTVVMSASAFLTLAAMTLCTDFQIVPGGVEVSFQGGDPVAKTLSSLGLAAGAASLVMRSQEDKDDDDDDGGEFIGRTAPSFSS